MYVRLCRAPPKWGERYRRGNCPKEAAFESVFCSAIVRYKSTAKEAACLVYPCVLVQLHFFQLIAVQACKRAYVRVNARLVVTLFTRRSTLVSSLSFFLSFFIARSLSFSIFFCSFSIYTYTHTHIQFSFSFSLSFPFVLYSRCLRHLYGSRMCKSFSRTWTLTKTPSDLYTSAFAGDTNLARHYAIDVQLTRKNCLLCWGRRRRWCCAACFYLCFLILCHDEETLSLPLPPPPPLLLFSIFCDE